MFNDIEARYANAPTQIRKLTGTNDFLFMENQNLTRRLNALKKSEIREKSIHEAEIQAKNAKISKLREIVACRDREKRKLKTRIERIRYSENWQLAEKRKLQALVDSQSNIMKSFERKFEIQKSKIANLEANLALDDNRGRAYWLVQKANKSIADLELKNEALMKDVEAVTQKYETEKEYTAACKPLMEIGAIIRTRYIYDRLLGLGIIGEMPRFILPAANRYVHWADMKADLALFKTGLWTSQNEGAFFKAVYPGHSVESIISLEKRSHNSTLTFMNLGIMYQDLHRPGRDFGLKDFPCSEKFQELQKELQDFIAFRSNVQRAGTKTTAHEDKYIELKLGKMVDLMAAFRRAEDTKLALSWLTRDGKGTFLTKEHRASSTKATAAAWFTRTRKAISEIVTPTSPSASPSNGLPFHKMSFKSEIPTTASSPAEITRKSMAQDAKGFVELFLESQAALHPLEGYSLRDENYSPRNHNAGGNQSKRELEEILEESEISDDEMSDEGLFIVPIDESRRDSTKFVEKGYQSRVMDLESVS